MDEAACVRPAGLFGDQHGYEQDWQDASDDGSRGSAYGHGGASDHDHGSAYWPSRDGPYDDGPEDGGPHGRPDHDAFDRAFDRSHFDRDPDPHGCQAHRGPSSHRSRASACRHRHGSAYHHGPSHGTDDGSSRGLIGLD